MRESERSVGNFVERKEGNVGVDFVWGYIERVA